MSVQPSTLRISRETSIVHEAGYSVEEDNTQLNLAILSIYLTVKSLIDANRPTYDYLRLPTITYDYLLPTITYDYLLSTIIYDYLRHQNVASCKEPG
jgi:hypothetical protein